MLHVAECHKALTRSEVCVMNFLSYLFADSFIWSPLIRNRWRALHVICCFQSLFPWKVAGTGSGYRNRCCERPSRDIMFWNGGEIET